MPPRSAKKGKKPPAHVSGATTPEPKPSLEALLSAAEEPKVPLAAEEEKSVAEAVGDQEVPAEDEEVEYREVSANRDEGDSGTEQEVIEEGIGKSEVEDTKDNKAGIDGDDHVDAESDDDSHDEENEEEDASEYMQTHLTERKKQKELDIYIGRLHKETVEDDLIKVFGIFGEIESVKIAKHPLTQKSKGFAFIRYKTSEQAKKALLELKDDTEVRGKRVKISAGQDNDTLYVGNICKIWRRNHVIETLKGYGVEQIEQILLPDDPKNEGKSKGFAFLEFSSHADAMAAFQRLKKPDAVFGCDRSAKVAFTQTRMQPSEEAMSQVRTVYVEGLPLSWDEEKVKEICKKYGEIEKVQLSRNFTKNKRKDFGFIAFTSRESAISFMEGINNSQFGEGEVKVKASLAKPQNKGRLAKQGARGGFKVKRDGEGAEEIGQSKKKSNGIHGKERARPKMKNIKESRPSKSQGKDVKGENSALVHPKTVHFTKGKKRGGSRYMDTAIDERPSKKARNQHNFVAGNVRARSSTGSGIPRNAHFGNQKVNYAKRSITSASRNAAPAANYQDHAYARVSESEPYAGYLPGAKQGGNPYGHEYRRAVGYSSQPRSAFGYAGEVSLLRASYPDYSSYIDYQAGYTYSSSGAYALRGVYYQDF